MNNLSKKSILLLIMIFMFCVFISAGTYSLLLWQSNNNTELTIKIGDVAGVYFKTGNNINVSNLGPVFDYEKDGEATYFKITNYVDRNLELDANFNIINITDNVKHESFKYVLLKSNDNINYEKIKEGNFLNISNGSTINLFSSYVIPSNSSITYKIILYIDGNVVNPITIQNGNFVGSISISEHL